VLGVKVGGPRDGERAWAGGSGDVGGEGCSVGDCLLT
jgi:hypothetical protein